MRSCFHRLEESGRQTAEEELGFSSSVEGNLASAIVSVSEAEGGEDSLEDLVLLLKRRIGESDWLEQQTASLSKHGSNTE